MDDLDRFLAMSFVLSESPSETLVESRDGGVENTSGGVEMFRT